MRKVLVEKADVGWKGYAGRVRILICVMELKTILILYVLFIVSVTKYGHPASLFIHISMITQFNIKKTLSEAF